MYKIPLTSFVLVGVYLNERKSPSILREFWKHTCEGLKEAIQTSGLPAIMPVIKSLQQHRLSQEQLAQAYLDEAILANLTDYFDAPDTASPEALLVIKQLLDCPDPLVGQDFPTKALILTANHLENLISQTLSEGPGSPIPTASSFSFLFDIIRSSNPTILNALRATTPVAVTLFQLAYLLPRVHVSLALLGDKAAELWKSMLPCESERTLQLSNLVSITAAKVGGYLLESGSRLEYVFQPRSKPFKRFQLIICQSPFVLSAVVSEFIVSLESFAQVSRSDLWASFLPDEQEMESLSQSVRERPISPILAILQPLVWLTPDLPEDVAQHTADHTAFLRAGLAWIAFLSQNRASIAHNVWFLQYALLIRDLAEDQKALNLSPLVSQLDLPAVLVVTSRLSSYIVSHATTNYSSDWHSGAISALRRKTPSLDPMIELLSLILHRLQSIGQATTLCRVFSQILHMVMRYTDASWQDAEKWLAFAQSYQTDREAFS